MLPIRNIFMSACAAKFSLSKITGALKMNKFSNTFLLLQRTNVTQKIREKKISLGPLNGQFFYLVSF